MAPSPDPSPFDRFARFYDGDYRHYDEDLDLIGHYAGEHGDPILELGCGTGRVLLSLARAGHRRKPGCNNSGCLPRSSCFRQTCAPLTCPPRIMALRFAPAAP
jgi:SAM-dependent methyltransferase